MSSRPDEQGLCSAADVPPRVVQVRARESVAHRPERHAGVEPDPSAFWLAKQVNREIHARESPFLRSPANRNAIRGIDGEGEASELGRGFAVDDLQGRRDPGRRAAWIRAVRDTHVKRSAPPSSGRWLASHWQVASGTRRKARGRRRRQLPNCSRFTADGECTGATARSLQAGGHRFDSVRSTRTRLRPRARISEVERRLRSAPRSGRVRSPSGAAARRGASRPRRAGAS